jgi:hypothetical protein
VDHDTLWCGPWHYYGVDQGVFWCGQWRIMIWTMAYSGVDHGILW